MSVVIVDYGSGNLRSAAKAFERAVREAGLSLDVCVEGEPDAVKNATHVVLPGVGAFGDCRRGLDHVPGLTDALIEAVIDHAKPFLGICVGMQLLASVGREHGVHPGLDWIPGEVRRLEPDDPSLKIPHMGWNELNVDGVRHAFLDGVSSGSHAYFVHSYGFDCRDEGHVLATVDYGGPVTAIVGRDNMVGTQFHPEKSQSVGLHLIGNFLRWRP